MDINQGVLMFVSAINSIGFKGQTKYLSCDANGNYKKIAEYQYGSKAFGDTRGLSDFILKRSYPYAGVEETIGKLHDNQTYKIYIADPMEVVQNSIRHSHDYIVYDREPSFPDIKKGYDISDEGNLNKEFQTLQDYYERLEKTAVKNQDKEFAKSKLELVAKCRKIYDESALLREERDKLIFKKDQRANMIELIKSNVEDFTRKLSVKTNTIQTHKRSYNAKDRKLNVLLDKKAILLSSRKIVTDKIEDIDNSIKIFSELKEILGAKIRNYESKVEYWKNYIANAPKRIAEYSDDIINMEKRLKEIEKELKPNYDKLCQFYTKNCIKITKRI